MGPLHTQLVMYDAYFSRSKRQEFGVFSLDDIDGAFAPSRWTLLNYAQPLTLPPLPGAWHACAAAVTVDSVRGADDKAL